MLSCQLLLNNRHFDGVHGVQAAECRANGGRWSARRRDQQLVAASNPNPPRQRWRVCWQLGVGSVGEVRGHAWDTQCRLQKGQAVRHPQQQSGDGDIAAGPSTLPWGCFHGVRRKLHDLGLCKWSTAAVEEALQNNLNMA
jgi:hypothetical protein